MDVDKTQKQYQRMGVSYEDINKTINTLETDKKVNEFLDGLVELNLMVKNEEVMPSIDTQLDFYKTSKENGLLNSENDWSDMLSYISFLSETNAKNLPRGAEFITAFSLLRGMGSTEKLKEYFDRQKTSEYGISVTLETVPEELSDFEAQVEDKVSLLSNEKVLNQTGYRNSPNRANNFYEEMDVRNLDDKLTVSNLN